MTTNAAGVRDYYPGDSLNRIHWPTTARMRRLMTKEFELIPRRDIWLYLDLSRDTVAAMPWQPEPSRNTVSSPWTGAAGAGAPVQPPADQHRICGDGDGEPGALSSSPATAPWA
ncbi:MAG: DUF58 domain-containing protein [Caldilineaceae bacterium]